MIIDSWESLEKNYKLICQGQGRVIHQIWLDYSRKPGAPGPGSSPPASYLAYRESWRVHHPNYFHVFWTDDLANPFISKYFPNFKKHYEGYPNPVSRVDSLKYLALVSFGGFYIDMDMECKGTIDYLREQTLLFEIPQAYHKAMTAFMYRGYMNDPRKDTACNNSFLGAKGVNDPFWAYVCEQLPGASKSIFNKVSLLGVMASAGPLFLESCFNAYVSLSSPVEIRGIKDSGVRILRQEEFQRFAVDYQGKTWLNSTVKWEILFIIAIVLMVILLLVLSFVYKSAAGLGITIIFITLMQQFFPQYMLWIAFIFLGLGIIIYGLFNRGMGWKK